MFQNGTGSYDVVVPKIRELLRRHRSRPIGARVTLTHRRSISRKIFRHLTEEIGFWEVGFAPVTTSPSREYAIAEEGFDYMLEQFQRARGRSSSRRLENRHHGFSNVKDTLEEIHKGVSKPFLAARAGLMGVSTDGDVALCHRFAGSDEHKLGTVRDGHRPAGADRISREASHRRQDRLQPCWARPLCSGGCYHEAHTRYGDTGGRICITATGFAAGPIPVCKFTASCRCEIHDIPRAIRLTRGGTWSISRVRLTAKPTAIAEHRHRRETDTMLSRCSRDPAAAAARTSRSAARLFSRRDGKPITTAARRDSAQPVERDLFDCHDGCFWPAQVPDQLNHAPDWTSECAAAQKDWRKIDLVFP